MMPWVYEFRWELGHIVFLLLFFFVMVVVIWTVIKAFRRTSNDLGSGRKDDILWEAAFEDLAAASKRCRHELAGELRNRACPNGFDCRRCEVHQQLIRRRGAGRSMKRMTDSLSGLVVANDLYYHRGHAWVRAEKDGTATIGLDDLGQRLVGTPDAIELPSVGARLHVNGTALVFKRGKATARILCPVDGEVIATGGKGEGWYLRVKGGPSVDRSHLLRGEEAKAWFLYELDRLQRSLGGKETGVALADGGTLVADIPDALKEGYDAVWEEMFLEV